MSGALGPHIESGEVAGLVALVGLGADIEVTVLGAQSVGGAPIRHDSLFRIASAGKPITAAAVLTMVADGLVGLDEPVGEALPEIASPHVLRQLSGPVDDTVPAMRPITVHDLLSLTSLGESTPLVGVDNPRMRAAAVACRSSAFTSFDTTAV